MKSEEVIKNQTKETLECYMIPENLEQVPVDVLRGMYKDVIDNSIPKKE